MKYFSYLNLILIFSGFMLFGSCQNNREEKSQGMFMYNPNHTGYYKSPSIKTNPSLLWKVKTEGPVISSPVVTDGVVYCGSNDHKLYAIDATTGEKIWVYETNGAIPSTPLITDEKVYILSYDGFFYAINRLDGTLAWKFQTGGETKFHVKDYFNGSFQPDFWDFYLSSPVAVKENVYFGSSDSTLYALNMHTGNLVWRYKAEGSIHSTPAIDADKLIFGAWDSRVYCLDLISGELNWRYATGRDTSQYIWLGIQASPSIGNDYAYVGSRDGKFYALNLNDGDTAWVNEGFHGSWMPGSAAIDSHNIYTGSSDAFSFYSLDKLTGKINYQTKTNAYTFSSPAIDETMAYIGSANGRLYGIEKNSGDILWEFQTEGISEDTLQFFDDKGQLDLERAKELTQGISTMNALTELYTDVFISTGSILSSPSIDNQIIYFGSSDGYIYAITDK